MLLSKLIANPDRFQFRDGDFSEQTVAAIVSEGIDLGKFDPLPIVQMGEAYCVAGDGHSRFEAICRLWAGGAMGLPDSWIIPGNGLGDDELDIPCRVITEDQARELSWTANLARDNFTPCEEARVFQDMLDAGRTLAQIAKASHRSVGYIQKTLPLNCLCRDIAAMVGRPEDAGGVDKYIAQAMAERFARYGIPAMQQQELWHKVFKHVSLTSQFVRAVLDRIGEAVAASGGDAMLFALPANIEHVVDQLRDRAAKLHRAKRGIMHLLAAQEAGVLERYPDLVEFLDRDGQRMLNGLKAETMADAEIVGNLCGVA